jgi:hypothetical protein
VVAGLVEILDVNNPDPIPAEVRARVECNALFDALQAGDYAAAARAQERLRALGWHVRRDSAPRRPARRPVQKAGEA